MRGRQILNKEARVKAEQHAIEKIIIYIERKKGGKECGYLDAMKIWLCSNVCVSWYRLRYRQ